MSEHLTHIAIFEDTARLVAHAAAFEQAFKASLWDYPDAGLIASGSRGNHLFAIPLLESVRDSWQADWPTAGPRISAAIGWLSHRAIDLQVKPHHLKPEEITAVRYSKTEEQIYHDAVTFDQVYQRGRMPSASPYVYLSEATLAPQMRGHPGAALLHVAQTEPLICALVQQQLLALREFHETAATPEAWLDQFPDHYQDLSEDLETYIEAFTQPDPLKMQTYIDGPNVYDPADPLIRLVRDLQHRGQTGIDLDAALAAAETQSHYAQGLRRSYRFVRAAQDFFLKKISKDAVYDQVEIFHPPHRQ